MTSILGRMATYSGQTVRWDDALKSGQDLSPKVYAFDAASPALPDKPDATPYRSRVWGLQHWE